MSGRRVKGREAIACDAAGALDLVAATGTLTSRGRWASLSHVSVMSVCRSDLWMLTSSPGPPCRVGPPGPQPGASVAGRGGVQRSRLDPIRRDSATDRTRTSYLCRVLTLASSSRTESSTREMTSSTREIRPDGSMGECWFSSALLLNWLLRQRAELLGNSSCSN